MAKIKFLKDHSEYCVKGGTEFLELHAKHPEAPLKFGCRRGECGTCAAKIVEGQTNLTKQSASEIATLERKGLDANSHRLLCQCAFNGDVSLMTNF